MRILHLVTFFDSSLGYAEYYLARKQLELGFDVKVVCSRYQIRSRVLMPSGLMLEDGIPVIRLKIAYVFRGNVLFNPFELANIIKEFSPDIVHCHGLLSPLAQEALLLKRSHRYKVVGDLITGISPLTSIFLPKLNFISSLWFSKKVDAFFACNKAVEKFLIKALGVSPSKLHFIPLGADVELFKPDHGQREKTRKFLGLLPGDVVAIYTGKFLPSKRIHDLLVASKSVIEWYNNFKLVLVGDGPLSYKERLESLIKKLRIENNTLMVKVVHRTKLSNFYNAADFAVWPGSFSISIIEAMACGLPIIIAKSDWTSHYLENENGYSFIAGDIPTLSSLLLTLVGDEEMRRLLGRRSRKLVEDKFNWDIIAKQYGEVYESVMNT